jgi:hypothetical protein
MSSPPKNEALRGSLKPYLLLRHIIPLTHIGTFGIQSQNGSLEMKRIQDEYGKRSVKGR